MLWEGYEDSSYFLLFYKTIEGNAQLELFWNGHSGGTVKVRGFQSKEVRLKAKITSCTLMYTIEM